MRTITLEIHNLFGEVIAEHNLILENGDVLICQINQDPENIDPVILNRIVETLQRAVETNNIKVVFVPDWIDFKILKKRNI